MRSGLPCWLRVVPRSQYTGKRERLIVRAVSTDANTQKLSIDTIRTLAMDGVQKANAGHPGTAMALAPLAYLLYRRRDAPQPGEPGLAEPRPVHPLRRPRLHPPVRRAPPLRLQPLARGAEALPPVGVADARPSGALPHRRRRDDDRPARAGVRERRRLRDRRALPRRALQPAAPRDRRPPRLRDLLGRRPDGGRLEGGRVDRRPPRPRASSSTSTTTTTSRSTARPRSRSRPRTRASASRRTAGTSSPSRTPRTSTRSSGRSAPRRPRRSGRRWSSCAATSRTAPRTRSTPRSRTARRSARTRCARRRRRSGSTRTRTSTSRTRSTSTWTRGRRGIEAEQEWQRALRALGRGVPEAPRGVGRRPHRQAAAGLDRGAARVPGRRGRRDARRGQEGDAGVQAVHADDDRRRGRPRRVDEDRVRGRRRLLRDARRPQHRVRDPRARDGLDRQRDRADAGDAEAVRLDVPDLLRLHAARPCGSRRSGTCSRSGSGRTTRSGSARTGRRTSRSSTTWRSGRSRTSGTCGPATRTRRRCAWRIALEREGGPVALALSRQKVPTLDRSEVAPARARCAARTCSGSRATGCRT